MSRFVFVFLLAVLFLRAQGGPPGAVINDLDVAPGDPDVMMAATTRGVYRSTTAGQTWIAVNEGLPRLSIPRVTGNREVLYVAAREDGVYRSLGGGPFEFAGSGIENQTILSVEADPTNVDVVYAGSTNGQIFKSVNRGESWASSSQGLDDGSYNEISISPVDPDWILASNLSADGTVGRLVRSVNGGGEWQTAVAGFVAISGVAFAPTEHGTAWVATSNGLIRTTNFGGSFEAPFFVGTRFLDVAVDPADTQLVYAATLFDGVIQTADGGANWNVTGAGLPRAAVLRIEATAESVFAGLSGTGVYRSHDGGGSWQLSAAGIRSAAAPGLAVDPSNGSNVLASTTGGGIFRSLNAGGSWTESRDGMARFEIRSIEYVPQSGGIVYAGAVNPFVNGDGALLQSTDGGKSWSTLAANSPFMAIATHPSDGNTAYFGTNTDGFSSGLLRTTDRGQNFQFVSGNLGELAGLDVMSITVDPDNGQNIYVTTRDRFLGAYSVAWTADGGQSWFGGLTTGTPWTQVAVDPADSNRFFIASLGGLARTTNGGDNFAFLTNGLPDDGAVSVGAIAIDGNDSSAIYAATGLGIYKSTDGGDNWALSNTGLGDLLVSKLRVDASKAGVLYAGTFGGGVFKTTNGGAIWLPTGGVPGLAAAGVVNAATFENGPIAPGEIISIFVLNGGPAEGITATEFDPATGKLATTLGGVRVFFNDIPGALFFVRSDQINVQAPFEIAGLETVEIRIEFEGALSSSVTVAVRPADPGLFAPVLNQDFSLNTESNRAARGSVVQVFGTGQGAVTPALISGLPAPGVAPLPVPDAAIRVLVNGQEALIRFAGLTPGLVGLLQLNVELPAGLSGEVVIEVFVGGVASPTTVTVFVS